MDPDLKFSEFHDINLKVDYW